MRRVFWLMLVAACASAPKQRPLFFHDPQSAVPAIESMVRKKDWKTLARYYRLDGSGVERATLESGAFFYTEQRPASADPAGLWKYRHPLAPGCKLLEVREMQALAQVEVVTVIEIDQGGGMVQRALRSFLMFRGPEGYQILPGEAPSR